VLAPVPTLVSLQLKWQQLHEELAAQARFVRQLQSENERLQSENATLSQPVVARGGSRQQLCPVPVRQVGLETHHLLSQSQSAYHVSQRCHTMFIVTKGAPRLCLNFSTLLLPPPLMCFHKLDAATLCLHWPCCACNTEATLFIHAFDAFKSLCACRSWSSGHLQTVWGTVHGVPLRNGGALCITQTKSSVGIMQHVCHPSNWESCGR